MLKVLFYCLLTCSYWESRYPYKSLHVSTTPFSGNGKSVVPVFGTFLSQKASMWCWGGPLIPTWARTSVGHFDLETHLITFWKTSLYYLIILICCQFAASLEILIILCYTCWIETLISSPALPSSPLSFHEYGRITSTSSSTSLLSFDVQ